MALRRQEFRNPDARTDQTRDSACPVTYPIAVILSMIPCSSDGIPCYLRLGNRCKDAAAAGSFGTLSESPSRQSCRFPEKFPVCRENGRRLVRPALCRQCGSRDRTSTFLFWILDQRHSDKMTPVIQLIDTVG